MRVAERWFSHVEIDDGVILIREPHVDPWLQANVFLVRGRDRDALIDSGLGLGSLRAELADLFERPVVAIATHRHFDHVGGLHEFEEVVVHRDDAEAVRTGDLFASVDVADYPDEEFTGYDDRPTSMLRALPREGFELSDYRIEPAEPTRVVEDGDTIDLGDRSFTVLHLPGHTPGEIGLWEAETRTLYSGDCVYESGMLLDELEESNIPDYVASMERLRDIDVRVVRGGHDDEFGRPRLLELIDDYVGRRGVR
jgi:glyoxylase-like metal-dependent hydrolase (beta-lactamase superfamily II)